MFATRFSTLALSAQLRCRRASEHLVRAAIALANRQVNMLPQTLGLSARPIFRSQPCLRLVLLSKPDGGLRDLSHIRTRAQQTPRRDQGALFQRYVTPILTMMGSQ
jgi:hypothetical protein